MQLIEYQNLESWIINKNQSKSSINFKTWNQRQSIKNSQICNIIMQLTKYQNLESWIRNKSKIKICTQLSTWNKQKKIHKLILQSTYRELFFYAAACVFSHATVETCLWVNSFKDAIALLLVVYPFDVEMQPCGEMVRLVLLFQLYGWSSCFNGAASQRETRNPPL